MDRTETIETLAGLLLLFRNALTDGRREVLDLHHEVAEDCRVALEAAIPVLRDAPDYAWVRVREEAGEE